MASPKLGAWPDAVISSRLLHPENIRKLTTPRRLAMHKVIRHLTAPELSKISRTSNSSSLGLLDVLPPEILLEVLQLIDFQSLSRFLRISLKGKEVVEAFRLYHEVMRHCPKVLAALGETRLLRHHSTALVRQVLSEQKCASCFEFGGFLFLPTCERICHDCLDKNYAFHLTKVSFAKKWFNLSNKELRRIPIMQSIPGRYQLRPEAKRKHCRSHQLVSVKQLMQLAIDVYGSPENVAKIMPAEDSDIDDYDRKMLEKFNEAPLKPPGCDLSKLPFDYIFFDQWPGMAAIEMPSLINSHCDYGRECQGCDTLLRRKRMGILPRQVVEKFVPHDLDPVEVLRAMASRLRPRAEFYEHLRHCYGVAWMFIEDGPDLIPDIGGDC
ncbi:F-box domain-containing protein [Fusarium sp. LHS14.1]|nr:F-box domain-containing protein [Fusarium sp. LHS14.1]